MKYIEPKDISAKYYIRKSVIYFIGFISVIGMIITGWGTSYTNYVPLQETFHVKALALGMAVSITLVWGFSSFIINCPKIYRFMNFLIICISTYLAMNTVSMNMIKDHEARIAADPESRRLYERYQNLERQYSQTMQNYELALSAGKYRGAQSYREQGEDLKFQAQLAFEEWKKRNEELKNMGSIQQEASVASITAILPISSRTVQMASKVMLSLINDLSFKFFAFIVSIIFSRYVMIHIPNMRRSRLVSIKQWCISFISRKRSFKLASRQIEIHKKAIKKARIDFPHVSYQKLGEIAARNVGRERPFSKSFVCMALKS